MPGVDDGLNTKQVSIYSSLEYNSFMLRIMMLKKCYIVRFFLYIHIFLLNTCLQCFQFLEHFCISCLEDSPKILSLRIERYSSSRFQDRFPFMKRNVKNVMYARSMIHWFRIELLIPTKICCGHNEKENMYVHTHMCM